MNTAKAYCCATHRSIGTMRPAEHLPTKTFTHTHTDTLSSVFVPCRAGTSCERQKSPNRNNILVCLAVRSRHILSHRRPPNPSAREKAINESTVKHVFYFMEKYTREGYCIGTPFCIPIRPMHTPCTHNHNKRKKLFEHEQSKRIKIRKQKSSK